MTDRRLTALDGLRGWAAFAVCVYHFGPELFGVKFPVLKHWFLQMIFNGPFAVTVFFVLSGFVLTYGGWRAPKDWAWRQLGKRYLRLSIPIIGITAITFGLMVLGLTRHVEAGAVLAPTGWRIDDMLRFEPTVGSALGYATFWVFTPRGDHSYNPFLWTMPFEMIGSVAVILICIAERGGRTAYWVLGGLTAFIGVTYPVFACFPAGALLALMKKDGKVPELGRWAWPAVIAGLLLAGPVWWTDRVMPTSIAGAILVLMAAMSRGPRELLEAPVSQFLGRVSFPLYLMQVPIIVTVASVLILQFPLSLPTALAIAVLSTAATVLAAWLFLPVERFAISFSNGLMRRIRRRQPA